VVFYNCADPRGATLHFLSATALHRQEQWFPSTDKHAMFNDAAHGFLWARHVPWVLVVLEAVVFGVSLGCWRRPPASAADRMLNIGLGLSILVGLMWTWQQAYRAWILYEAWYVVAAGFGWIITDQGGGGGGGRPGGY